VFQVTLHGMSEPPLDFADHDLPILALDAQEDSKMKKRVRWLRLKELLERVPFSRATIDRLESRGEFPPRHHLGRGVFWIEAEIESFLATREKGSGKRQPTEINA
jgi:predicted DNA-binding transcriptional regulator AlpA